MYIESVVSDNFAENTWLIGNQKNSEAIIIDPGADYDKIIEKFKELELTPVLILNTHLHPDHLFSARKLQKSYQIPLMAHRKEKQLFDMFDQIIQKLGLKNIARPEVEQWLKDEEILDQKDIRIKVIHTPGHSPGSCCFLVNDLHLFTGDTVFSGSIGRTDLPLGSSREMRESLKKITNLPIKTKIYPGHGPKSDLKAELNNNPYLI
jgi:glyoxylase-like metal-dependent hydrolase (beta-lactamase superfamily II)